MTTVCNSRVLMISSLLDDALEIKETLHPKSPGRVRFCETAISCFPELIHVKTKTPYTCIRKLLMLYVSTKEDAELTFTKFKLLLPHMFNQVSTFKTRCIHFCELRKSFKNKHREVGECADDIFRLSRKDGLEHKRNYVKKPSIVLDVSLAMYINLIFREMTYEICDSRLTVLVLATGCKIADLIECDFERTDSATVIRKTDSKEEYHLVGIETDTFFQTIELINKDIEVEHINKSHLKVLNKYEKLVMDRLRTYFHQLTKSAGVKKVQLLHAKLSIEFDFMKKAECILSNVDLQKEIGCLKDTIKNLKRKYDTDEYEEEEVSTKRPCIE